MALSELGKKIRRLHLLHARGKELDREIDALKAYFREKAGTDDAVFESRNLQVPVTWKERLGWDGQKLDLELGEKARDFKKVARYAEVSVRKKDGS